MNTISVHLQVIQKIQSIGVLLLDMMGMMTDLINFGTSSANDDNSLNQEEVPLLKNIPNNGVAIISPQSVGEQEDNLKLPKPGGIKVTPAGSTAEK